MSYPAPPPASQPPEHSPSGGSDASRSSGLSSAQAGGFFNDLFDIRFTRFVSLRLISVVYVVILIAVSLVALGFVFVGFASGAAAGLFALVLAVLGWVIYVVLARVALEAFAVLFRIHDDTSRVADALGGVPPIGGSGQGYDPLPGRLRRRRRARRLRHWRLRRRRPQARAAPEAVPTPAADTADRRRPARTPPVRPGSDGYARSCRAPGPGPAAGRRPLLGIGSFAVRKCRSRAARTTFSDGKLQRREQGGTASKAGP